MIIEGGGGGKDVKRTMYSRCMGKEVGMGGSRTRDVMRGKVKNNISHFKLIFFY